VTVPLGRSTSDNLLLCSSCNLDLSPALITGSDLTPVIMGKLLSQGLTREAVYNVRVRLDCKPFGMSLCGSVCRAAATPNPDPGTPATLDTHCPASHDPPVVGPVPLLLWLDSRRWGHPYTVNHTAPIAELPC